MNKLAYRKLCRQQLSAWLTDCAHNPSPSMRPVHVAIIKLVLRERASKGAA